jgi:hypothetical protein
MSMSTQHPGGNRKPSTRPVAGAKPKQGGDEVDLDTDALDAETSTSTSDAASAAPEDESDAAAAASTRLKASPRKSAPARKVAGAKATGTKATGTKATGTSATTASATGAKTAVGAKAAPAKAGTRPSAKAAAGRRVAPVKVNEDRNWGPIALFSAVGLIAVVIIAFAGYQVYEKGLTWQQRADKINGIVDFHKKDPKSLEYQQHTYGPIKYKYSPPVGGTHNPNWQRCQGDVYPAAIASEHAVHSMEHGAVWITYNPSLPADQVEMLAAKVRGNEYMLMSPFPGLDKPISVQTWGYQLKVDKASDSRIDEFIKDLKQNAAFEQGATCTSGSFITATGPTPHDLQPQDTPAPQAGG